jgi:thiol:disulfide interchange protein
MPATEAPGAGQRRIPRALLLLLAAAAVFRLATLARPSGSSRPPGDLVEWARAEEAPRLARERQREILYDFNAEWCGPCHRLDEAVFADPDSAAFINGRFIAVSVVDRVAEEGRNSPIVDSLQQKYGINAFPTLVVASQDGTPIARMEGFPGRAGVLEFLKAR